MEVLEPETELQLPTKDVPRVLPTYNTYYVVPTQYPP